MAKNKEKSDGGGASAEPKPEPKPEQKPEQKPELKPEQRPSMTDAAGDGAGQSEIQDAIPDGPKSEIDDTPNPAEFAAGVVELIESGTLEPAHLKDIQAALSLSLGPGGANEGKAQVVNSDGPQSEIQDAISDGPKSEIDTVALASAIDEKDIEERLEEFAIGAPKTTSPGELSDSQIAAELESIGEPLGVVREVNAIWLKAKEASEQEAEKNRRVLNLLVYKRSLLEEASQKLLHRGNTLREELARRAGEAAKNEKPKKVKK